MASTGRQIADLRSGEAEVLPEEPTGDPSLGRVKIWAHNDVVNGLLLKFKMRGTHATVKDDNNTIAFIAQEIGDPGNDLQVALLAAEAGEELTATYNRFLKRLTVKLRTTAEPTTATVTSGYEAPPYAGDIDLVFTAKVVGAAGNNRSVVIHDLGVDAVADTTAEADGNQVLVTLEQTAGPVDDVAATLETDLGGNADLVWENDYASGASANGSTFSYVLDSGAGDHSVTPDSDLPYPNVGLKFGPGTTAQDVLDYYTAHPELTIKATGLKGGSSGVGDIRAGTWTFEGGQTAGGTGTPLATSADVKAAIEADVDSNALVDVGFAKAGGVGAGLAPYDALLDLAGGVDADHQLTTNVELAALLATMPDVGKVFTVKQLGGEDVVGPIPITHLYGGDSDAVFVGELFSD